MGYVQRGQGVDVVRLAIHKDYAKKSCPFHELPKNDSTSSFVALLFSISMIGVAKVRYFFEIATYFYQKNKRIRLIQHENV